MATEYKVIAQSNPSATTNTDMYTVPSSTSIVCSTLTVCNQGTSDATFRLAVRPVGATLTASQYIFYDSPVYAKSTVAITIGMTLGTTDVVTVYASSADLSFSLFGSVIA